MNSGYIGNMTVGSNHQVIVYGSVRGLVSEHRTESGAMASLARDERGCRSQGGYSDARIYHWTNNGWENNGGAM
jgi:hypothetical protein